MDAPRWFRIVAKSFAIGLVLGFAPAVAGTESGTLAEPPSENESQSDDGEQSFLRAEASGSVAAPFTEVLETLLDLDHFPRWFPGLAEWRVLSRDASSAVVYGRQSLPWPFRDRDYVVVYRWWRNGSAFHLEATAQRNADPPTRDGVLRLESFRSEWQIRPGPGSGTRAQYSAEGPVEGRIVRWLESRNWRRHTHRVIDALAHEVRARSSEADHSDAGSGAGLHGGPQ